MKKTNKLTTILKFLILIKIQMPQNLIYAFMRKNDFLASSVNNDHKYNHHKCFGYHFFVNLS